MFGVDMFVEFGLVEKKDEQNGQEKLGSFAKLGSGVLSVPS
tara:strand:- start:241 stop:363 length:123 start_codon:yes stop_codon:yes gene_type:complete